MESKVLSISWCRTTEEERRNGYNSGIFCAFYWIKVSFYLHLAVLFICYNPICGIL